MKTPWSYKIYWFYWTQVCGYLFFNTLFKISCWVCNGWDDGRTQVTVYNHWHSRSPRSCYWDGFSRYIDSVSIFFSFISFYIYYASEVQMFYCPVSFHLKFIWSRWLPTKAQGGLSRFAAKYITWEVKASQNVVKAAEEKWEGEIVLTSVLTWVIGFYTEYYISFTAMLPGPAIPILHQVILFYVI